MIDFLNASRRRIFCMVGTGVLSAAAIGILARAPAIVAAKVLKKADIDIFDVALRRDGPHPCR